MGRQVLWLRWVLANALGELFGLGLTFGAMALVVTRLGDQPGALSVLLSFGLAVASGGIEATLVGLAQWWAMQPWFPTITRWGWWRATLVGALVAYGLGYLPSTLMSLAQEGGAPVAAEPPRAIVLLLAGGLGMVAGAVLSFAQWLEMRKVVRGAGWWMPANMLAWLAGMPIIFWGIDAAQAQRGPGQALLLLIGVLLLAGTVVGAIHGAFLVWLAGRRRGASGCQVRGECVR
jgi:hypothetical protein